MGWISRKGGRDSQAEGEKGEVQRIQYRIVEDGHGRQLGVGPSVSSR